VLKRAPPAHDSMVSPFISSRALLVRAGSEFCDRNAAVLRVREVGRDEWKKEAGDHRRSLTETAMMRLKTIFSDRLKAREWRRQDGTAGEVRRDEQDDGLRDAAELRRLSRRRVGEVYSTSFMQQRLAAAIIRSLGAS
jgi:hypothetical protein